MDKPILDYEKLIDFIAEYCDIEKCDIERVIDLETEYMRLIGIITDFPED